MSTIWLGPEADGVPLAPGLCPTDVNMDGLVDVGDFTDVILCFGTNGIDCPAPGNNTDTNSDGIVNEVDLAYVGETFGSIAPACALPGPVELFNQLFYVDVTTPDSAALGLTVTHLYATGPDVQAGDALLLAGFANIQADGTTVFFQEPVLGGDGPPSTGAIAALPAVEFDTFVTIDRLSDYVPNFGPTHSQTTTSIVGSWFGLGPERRAEDISAISCVEGQFGVRIAQISMETASGSPPSYSGTVRLYTSTGNGGTLGGVVASIEACPPPGDLRGACCCNGSCIITLEQDCDAAGGTFGGVSSECSDVVCGGACCILGDCVTLSEQDCTTILAGIYQGNNTTCDDVVCSYCIGDADFNGPTNIDDVITVIIALGADCGACQLPNGTCIVAPAASCTTIGGTPGGPFSSCSGGCDLSIGGCVDVATERACNDQGGTWAGHGTSCNTADGACCLGPGPFDCVELPPLACADVGGVYKGAGSTCANDCP